MKQHSVTAFCKAFQDYERKNFNILAERYLQKGFNAQMTFTSFCVQMFEKDYIEYVKKQEVKQYEHEQTF